MLTTRKNTLAWHTFKVQVQVSYVFCSFSAIIQVSKGHRFETCDYFPIFADVPYNGTSVLSGNLPGVAVPVPGEPGTSEAFGPGGPSK